MDKCAQESKREQTEIGAHCDILQGKNFELKTVPKDGDCFLVATIAQVPSAELKSLN